MRCKRLSTIAETCVSGVNGRDSQCFQESRRPFSVNQALLMIVFLLHWTELTGDGSLWNAHDRLCVLPLYKSRGCTRREVTVCGHTTETLWPCNSVPFATCMKDDQGGGGGGVINSLRAPAESRLFPCSQPLRMTSLRRYYKQQPKEFFTTSIAGGKGRRRR